MGRARPRVRPPSRAHPRGAVYSGCDRGGAEARRLPARALRVPARELRARRRARASRDPRVPIPRRDRTIAPGHGLRIRRTHRRGRGRWRATPTCAGRSGRDRPGLPGTPRRSGVAEARRRSCRVPRDPAGGRGPPVLRAPRDRSAGDPARGLGQLAGRPRRAGRQHPDATARQELLPLSRTHDHPQAERGAHRAAARVALLQARAARGVPERGVSRPAGRVCDPWLRSCRPLLLRARARGSRPRRDGPARGDGARAFVLRSATPSRAGEAASKPGDRPARSAGRRRGRGGRSVHGASRLG